MNREYGIDIIRFFAMFLVIIGHIVGIGGIVKAALVGSPQYYTALFLQVFSLCSINIFGIISGYVGYGKKIKPVVLIRTWLRVLFWSCTITFLFFVAGFHINQVILRKSFLPIISQTYWYITAYFVTSIVSPIINCFIEKTNSIYALIILLLGTLALSTVLTTSGNNPVWLILLYGYGALFKKTGVLKKIKCLYGIIGFLLCVICTWGATCLKDNGIVTWNRYMWSIWGAERMVYGLLR